MPPLLADFTHARPCKPFCEKYLTLPRNTLGKEFFAGAFSAWKIQGKSRRKRTKNGNRTKVNTIQYNKLLQTQNIAVYFRWTIYFVLNHSVYSFFSGFRIMPYGIP